MTNRAQKFTKAKVDLENAVMYGDLLGQLSNLLEIIDSCDVDDGFSVQQVLNKMQAYLPLIEATERAANATRELIGTLEIALEANSFPSSSA